MRYPYYGKYYKKLVMNKAEYKYTSYTEKNYRRKRFGIFTNPDKRGNYSKVPGLWGFTK